MSEKAAAAPARVVLVQPPSYDWLTPSNGLALINAHLRAAGVTPRIVDSSMRVRKALSSRLKRTFKDHVEYHEALTGSPRVVAGLLAREVDAILEGAPDVVAFAVLTYTEKWSLDMAAAIKALRPSTRVVFGGAQCLRENNAFEFIRNPSVDAVMLGEADVSFVKYLRALKRAGKGGTLPRIRGVLMKAAGGEILDGGDEEGVEDIDSLPFLDFSGFPMKDYVGDAMYINTTRSCVRRCRFCTHFMMQKVYGVMSPQRTLAEIQHHLETFPNRKLIIFSDSLVNGDTRRLAKLADLLLDFRLERLARRGEDGDFAWSGMAILHRTTTLALLRKLKASGCIELAYGLESGSQKVIDAMDKKFKITDAEEVIRNTKKAGIRVKTYLQFGFPGETEEDFRETLVFIRKNAAFLGQVSISFSEIYKGSDMDLRPEHHGIKLPIEDRTRWESSDGTNTYEIRMDRCRRAAETARKAGIDVVEVYASKLGF
ncbi:MAG TPA: radical SAM protein [Elusimicrobiota bacterium]|nr:radical SAM protein [Elusimicrobiota bacterium]